MNFAESHKTAHEKPCADQKGERESDLEDNDSITKASVAKASADSLAAISQWIIEVAPSGLQRRHQTENQRGRHRNAERKDQNSDVQADRCFGRNYILRKDGDQGFETTPSEQCAEGSAAGSENQAFDE